MAYLLAIDLVAVEVEIRASIFSVATILFCNQSGIQLSNIPVRLLNRRDSVIPLKFFIFSIAYIFAIGEYDATYFIDLCTKLRKLYCRVPALLWVTGKQYFQLSFCAVFIETFLWTNYYSIASYN